MIQKGLYIITLRGTKQVRHQRAVRDGAKIKSGGGELCQGVQLALDKSSLGILVALLHTY